MYAHTHTHTSMYTHTHHALHAHTNFRLTVEFRNRCLSARDHYIFDSKVVMKKREIKTDY